MATLKRRLDFDDDEAGLIKATFTPCKGGSDEEVKGDNGDYVIFTNEVLQVMPRSSWRWCRGGRSLSFGWIVYIQTIFYFKGCAFTNRVVSTGVDYSGKVDSEGCPSTNCGPGN